MAKRKRTADTKHTNTETAVFDVAVIGAGASGCMAAAAAAEGGARTLLLEVNDKIGKKLYATGNGRCNLTNLRMDERCYHVGGGGKLSAFFARFSVEDHIRFWESEGIFLHDRQGYVYPRTDQAATVAEAFEKILGEAGAQTVLGHRVTGLGRQKKGAYDLFTIESDGGGRYFAHKVILAGGGAAGPQYGCDGSIYGIARSLGHSISKPLPALVPLYSDDPDLSSVAGVRCEARITLTCADKESGSERGQLQMTERGISGIPVFQLSAPAARSLDRGERVSAVIDFLPDLTGEKWEAEKRRRLGTDKNSMLSVFFLGLVNRKVLDLLLRKRGLQAEKKASKLTDEALLEILEDMRALRLRITGTGDFRQAQVTSGGVPLTEVDTDLMSLKCKNLFLAGELLDVDGICGGYNLQWAMTSGWIAGKSAADRRSDI